MTEWLTTAQATDFPTWGSGKGAENPQGIQWDLIVELPRDWGNKTPGGYRQNL